MSPRHTLILLLISAALAVTVGASTDNIAELQQMIIRQASKQSNECANGNKDTDPKINVPAVKEKISRRNNESILDYITLFDGGNGERDAARVEMFGDVKNQWKLSSCDEIQGNDCKAAGGSENAIAQSKMHGETLFDRVNAIVVPHIAFVNTPLAHAVETLTYIAEKSDGRKNGDPRGINIVLLGSHDSDGGPVINLNLKNISLYRLIELVAESASHRFDITDDAVIFYKQDATNTILGTRFFPISRAALVRLVGARCDGDDSDQSVQNCGDERRIMEFLQRAGVTFSDIPGSNLAFDGAQIIVTNSGRNLKKIGDILQKYSAVRQVEIEAKFLEVQQGALDELGIRWMLGSRKKPDNKFLQTGQGSNGSDILRTAAEAFASSKFARGDGKIVFGDQGQPALPSTVPIPNSPPGLPGQINLGLASTALSSFTGVLNSLQCDLMIKALEQCSDSDLMSAPKLTVLSGKTAEIIIAMELRYPQRYGDTHSEVGTGSSGLGISNSAGVTITAGTPQDFTTRNIGVEMSVTPVVEEDGSISLQLEPRVTEFEGFVEYGGVSVGVSSNTTVSVPSGFYQPIFSTRKIHTEVNVFDGATVVMGGLTREEVKEVNDRVPILGDIPLIGRLFRSKSETTQKRNLLIFVSARTISPSGNKKAWQLPANSFSPADLK